MYKIAICDDNKTHIDITKKIILNTFKDNTLITIHSFNPNDFIKTLDNNSFCYDIVIMDIELSEEINGIALGDKINKLCPECQIIYLSGYPKYLHAVYETEHIYFVYKKKSKEILPTALNKAIDKLSNFSRPFLYINTNQTSQKLFLEDIIYIERIKRKTFIHTTKDLLVINKTLNEFLKESSPYPYLIRCHNSFIVNLNHIEKISRSEILLNTKEVLTISRSYINTVKDSFFKYFNESIL